jgi:hypothetical protein
VAKGAVFSVRDDSQAAEKHTNLVILRPPLSFLPESGVKTMIKSRATSVGLSFRVFHSPGLYRLSITHKLGRIESKLDVGESREPTPHDGSARRGVTSASKVAAKSGQLGDV